MIKKIALLSFFLFFANAQEFAQKQTIQSASELDYPPFSVVDKDGKADGFSVDLLREALKSMGKDVNFKVDEWNTIKNELEYGKLDALPLVGRTQEREKIFDFTIPYIQLFGALIVRADNTDIKELGDIKDKELIVMNGDNAEEFARRNALTEKIITTKSFEDALRLLSSGNGDAVLIQQLVGRQLMDKLKLPNIKMVEKPIASFRQDFSFAVKSNNKELLAILNEGLANTKANGSYDRIYRKWFHDPYKYTIGSLYWIAIGTLLFAILSIGLVVLILFNRRILFLRNQLQLKVDESTVKLIDTARRLRMLSSCNQAIPHAESEEELLRETCKIIYQEGGYPIVWAGYVAPENHNIITLKASYGIELESIIDISQMKDEPSCILYKSIAEKKQYAIHTHSAPVACPILYKLPDSMKKNASLLSIPLLFDGTLFGVIVIYSLEKMENAFDEHETELLVELASDIAYGIQNLKVAQREFESKRRFKNLVENISDILWEVDVNAVFTYVSPQIKELLGFEQHELLGKTPFDFMSPDEAEKVGSEFSKHAKEKTAFRALANTIIRKDGKTITMETSGNPILDKQGNLIGYRGVERDISEKIKYEESLRQYQRIADTSNDLMSLLDKEYVYQAVNRAYLKAWNKSKEEIIGLSAANLMGEEIFETKLKPNLDKCLMNGEHISYQAWFEYATEKHYMDVHYYPYKNQDGVLDGVVVNVHEITELKKMEESIKQKDEMMIAQSRQAAMGEMISMIAHQWRQPISAIGMAINNLKADIELDSFSIEEAEKKYDSILSLIEFLSKTIDDFRDFFRPEREKELGNFDDVIKDALKIIGKSIENNGIKISLELNAKRDLVMFRREMIQVFLNLLKNSKDVLADGRVENPQISIATKIEGDAIIARVCDNGGGIDNTIIEKIFEPYFTTKGPSSGTGLGLYMSKIIVENHHEGAIEATNINDGVCFEIKIGLEQQ